VSASETLNVTGGITLKKGDAGASMTIWGALDAADGTWHDPLGLKGLSIKGLGIELGAATVFPFIALGFRGDVYIGDALLHATLAFSFNPADLGSTVLQISSPEGINLIKLITSLLPVSFLPKDIFNVALTDLNFYLSPKGGSIAGKTYNKGAALAGKLNLWGYHAAVDGLIDYTSGGYLHGALDRISVSGAGLKFIEFTDAAGPGSPTLSIDLNSQRQGAHISGKLSLLSGFYSETVDVDVSSHGFNLTLSPNASGIYASAQVGFDGSTFSIAVSPGFRFGFTLFGQDISVSVKATVAIRVSSAGFYQSLGFTYSAFGSDHYAGSVSWSVPIYSPDDLKNVFAQFGDQVKKFFTDTMAGGLLTAVNWVKDNVVNDAKKVSSLFVSAGADSIQVAKGLVSSFGMSAEDAAKTVGNGMQDAARILKDGFGKSVSEVGAFMQNAYGASADAVNAALSGVGFAADQVNSFMHDAFSWFPHVDFPFVDSY